MTLDEINTLVINCRLCPRLVVWREAIAREKRRAFRNEEYWGKPVPGFGDPKASVFAVGLAPGAHGSNRTGRQFTGDASGDFLYPALFRAGFASQPNSSSLGDGMKLFDLYTAPICRCAPPNNKPNKIEISNCLPFLLRELEQIQPKVIVAFGRIAFETIARIFSVKNKIPLFLHNGTIKLPGERWLVSSYHPSRQNTQTGRLTVEMFDQVWKTVRKLRDVPG
jgi:uracil-DNA glycosylase